MNKFNVNEHPELLHSLSILHMENGDCSANIFCMDGDKYFVDLVSDKYSDEVDGNVDQLPENIVLIDTIELVQIRD